MHCVDVILWLQLRLPGTQLHNPRVLDFLALLSKVPPACKAPVQVPNHPCLHGINVLVHCTIDLLPETGEDLSSSEKAMDDTCDCLPDVIDSLLEGVPFVFHQDCNDI